MSQTKNKLLRAALGTLIGRVLALVAIGLFALTCLWVAQRPRECKLLDLHLGSSAWDPTALLIAMTWEYQPDNNNPHGLGHPDFFDVQHQALLRLLDLQKTAFGRAALSRCKDGTFVDSSFAKAISRTESEIVVLGTGTLEPCHYDYSSIHGPDPYWQVERFRFTPRGQLLGRESCRYEDKQGVTNSSQKNL